MNNNIYDNIIKEYKLWLKKSSADPEVTEELKAMKDNNDKIEDAFYRNLAFGTGGLRGIIGAGTNRMNIHTVARASQGLANYVKKFFPNVPLNIAVSYDSRIKSQLFAQTASNVFAANRIKVYLYPQLMPTPCLSFAVRKLGCIAGVMITASHNPSQYNGYKVYGADGCQITTEAAALILEEINKLDMFDDIKTTSFESGIFSGCIEYISETISAAFINEVKKQSVIGEDDSINRDIAIIYSPLNGTGLHPVLQVLNESGYSNIRVVEEQRQPDGTFPTCPYPNPEVEEAMALGIEYAKRHKADLFLATDPDCDRVGIAVRNKTGAYTLLSANETGILLLDYICSRRIAMGTMPKNPIFMKTIVTTGMAEQIASHYGVQTVNVLTGFKFIGEKIGELESKGLANSFIFGFEESYGYLSGTYVRDKDGVGATFLICEMFSYYANKGITLLDKLEELYCTYGYCLDTLHCYNFEGAAGFMHMQEIMKKLREEAGSSLGELGGKKIIGCLDYKEGLEGLPKSDVIKFVLEDHCSVVIRPSGTEPKMKVYISVSGENRKMAERVEREIGQWVEESMEILIN